MSTSFRSPRINRSYLSHIADQAGGVHELAPDIITERPRTLPPAAVPLPPAPVLRQPAAPPPKARAGSLSILEARHPDIAKAITLLWGYPEMNEYFSKLWLADGSQAPIDPDAMSELMLLARLHMGVTPQSPGRTLASMYGSERLFDPAISRADPWSEVPPRR